MGTGGGHQNWEWAALVQMVDIAPLEQHSRANRTHRSEPFSLLPHRCLGQGGSQSRLVVGCSKEVPLAAPGGPSYFRSSEGKLQGQHKSLPLALRDACEATFPPRARPVLHTSERRRVRHAVDSAVQSLARPLLYLPVAAMYQVARRGYGWAMGCNSAVSLAAGLGKLAAG
jgi:hypothetical protein